MFRLCSFVAVAVLAAGAAAAQDRPQVDRRPHLSIFTHAQYRQIGTEAAIVAAFANDDALRGLVQNSHFHHYTEQDPLYRARFARSVPLDQFPAILLQKADGGYVYKATGPRVPTTAAGIREEIAYYASLDPQSRPDTPRNQSGIDGVPDIDGPPSDCDGGTCPAPGGLLPGLATPDSAELLRVAQQTGPIRNITAAIILVAAVLIALAMAVFGGVILLALLYVLSKIFRR